MKSEAGRWYDPKTGQCVSEIIGKNGKARKPTIKDAVANGWYPSVTTILKVMAKPGLEAWKQQQVLLSAVTMPRKENESDVDFVARIMDEAGEIAADAAETGKDFHAAAQVYWQKGTLVSDDAGIAMFLSELDKFKHKMERDGWSGWTAEKAYVSGMGYAGTPDLWARRGDELLVVDYKTTDLTKYKEPYDEWACQIAAGIWGIEAYLDQHKAHGIELVVDRTSGEVVEEVWEREDIIRGYKMFASAFELWKLSNRWDERRKQ